MKMAPIKEEEIYLKPRLVIFYDVISEDEIQVVKDFASPRVGVKSSGCNSVLLTKKPQPYTK